MSRLANEANYVPALGWHFGIVRSVRLSVPWRSRLDYRNAGCLQLSYRRPPEMCGLRTRPRTDVDPPRFLPPTNCHRRRHIVSPPPRAIPCWKYFVALVCSYSIILCRLTVYCDESVCLSVCLSLSACMSSRFSQEPLPSSANFPRLLPVAVTKSACGGVAIRYVLPVYTPVFKRGLRE